MGETEMPMDTPGERTMYAIITSEGKLRGTGTSAGTLYATQGAARNRAREDGDSVIAVTINLRVEPLFIRGRKL